MPLTMRAFVLNPETMIYSSLSKLLDRYLNAWIIFFIDTFVSVCTSALVIAVVSAFKPLSLHFILCYVALSLGATLLAFLLVRPYRTIIRHLTLKELSTLFGAIGLKELLLIALLVMLTRLCPSLGGAVGPLLGFALFVVDGALSICFLIFVRLLMVVVYDYIKAGVRRTTQAKRVLIYGTSDKSVALVSRLSQSPHYLVVGFLDTAEELKRQKISDLPVFYSNDREAFKQLLERLSLRGLLFSTERDLTGEQDRLVRICIESGVKVLLSPTIDDIVDGRVMRSSVREIKIEDLLGRDEIQISMKEIEQKFKGKTVLVTGAAGSIGSELCRQLAMIGVGKLILFDNAETPMHNVRLEFEERFPHLQFVPVIGDVRYEQRLDFVFRTYRPSAVLHAAAYKHVPLMEENPCEAVLVNVGGTRNVARKCIEYGVENMVMISTDKAVNPTNIMGCTKRLSEIYVQSLGLALQTGELEGKTKFVTTRFGNVLGSNGSVIPRFREQIAKGGPVTVTHPEINRFFMTIPEACRLVMEATTLTSGNQIFVFDMGQSVKIDTLARRMIELAGFVPDKDIKIEYTGLRPGEKLFEEVLSDAENTTQTRHQRIRIAKVRQYNFADAEKAALELCDLARDVRIADMVIAMKRIVPEFKSRNSVFEKYDK